MKKPVNTTTETINNPVPFLADAMAQGTGTAVLGQESVGQKSFIGSETLPTEMHFYGDIDPRSILEAAGVKFLGVVEDDKIFQYVELPAGWKKGPSEGDDSRHSVLLDDKGRKRARIFYKAAFYDRRADLSLCKRYDFHTEHNLYDQGVVLVRVFDGEKILWESTRTDTGLGNVLKLDDDQWNNVRDALNSHQKEALAAAEKWLDENFPDWKNPAAYWD